MRFFLKKMKKVIYFLLAILMSITMISCSDMTVSSGYTYNPYPYSNYYYYHRPYYYYRPVYRERIIVVPRYRNTNKRYYDNSRRFVKGQRNNTGTTRHFGGRR